MRLPRKTHVTFADRVVLYVIVGTALILLLTGAGRETGGVIRITGANGFERVESLHDECSGIGVPGLLGETVVEIHDGRARVCSSPCPHELCVGMGAVMSPGQAIVCVPNRVVVTVEGTAPSPIHATTR